MQILPNCYDSCTLDFHQSIELILICFLIWLFGYIYGRISLKIDQIKERR